MRHDKGRDQQKPRLIKGCNVSTLHRLMFFDNMPVQLENVLTVRAEMHFHATE